MRSIAHLLIAALLINPISGACVSTPSNTDFERVVGRAVDANQFSGTVLVAIGDKVVFDKSYGMADIDAGTANTPATIYRLGSITKQFTAAAILLLNERGKLKLDDPIGKYVSDSPPAWNNITLAHLLAHTSGIPNYTDMPEILSNKKTHIAPERLIELIRAGPLEFTPGEKWHYSNSGYVLLGYVISRVSGQSYEKFIFENLLKPLDMKSTGYEPAQRTALPRAVGYQSSEGSLKKSEGIDLTWAYSAGGLDSDTQDMLRWERGLYGGKLLSQESLTQMTTPRMATGIADTSYGFGLFLRKVQGATLYEHGGNIYGFSSYMAYSPQGQISVIVLANMESSASTWIAQNLVGLFFEHHREDAPVVTLPLETLQQYVGDYVVDDGRVFKFRLKGMQPMVAIDDHPAIPADGISETKFRFREIDAQFEFFKDEQGRVVYLLRKRPGAPDFKAVRR